MTEKRIKELANKKLQELDISGKYMQPDDWSTLRVWAEDFAVTVAAKAREEGIEEGRDIAIAAFETDIDSTFWDLNRIRVFIQEAIAERLEEKGK